MTGWPLALALLLPAAEDGPLGLADLGDYQRALHAEGPAEPASFRALWDRPDQYHGRRVRVEGTVARLFRQPAVGRFPALSELWIVHPSGDPLCLVFPTDAGSAPPVGSAVAFTGTFLRRVRYRGGDADRLAPLLVGGSPPAVRAPAPPAPSSRSGWSSLDWWIGGGLGLMVVVVLGTVALRRPVRRDRPGPPPVFLDDGKSDPIEWE